MTDFQIANTDPFRKPYSIAKISRPEAESVTNPFEVSRLAKEYRIELEKQAFEKGFRLRVAVLADAKGIKALLHARFRPGVAILVSDYDLFRYISFGYVIVIEDVKSLEVVGFEISGGYDDLEKTSFGIIYATANRIGGQGLGSILEIYNAAIGAERHSRIRRGIVHPSNDVSSYTLLNKVGFMCEYFDKEFFGEGEPRFMLAYSVSAGGLFNNGTDMEKLIEFIKSHKKGVDYELVSSSDLDGIDYLYKRTPYRICAFLPKEALDRNGYFFAMHRDELHFPANGWS